MTSSREPLRQRAFTLIEVLVVIGVMAVVATLVGIGLSRGGVGAALKASQSLLVSQLNAARSQAALGESRTALVVVADVGSLERDRRFLAVAVEEGGGDGAPSTTARCCLIALWCATLLRRVHC